MSETRLSVGIYVYSFVRNNNGYKDASKNKSKTRARTSEVTSGPKKANTSKLLYNTASLHIKIHPLLKFRTAILKVPLRRLI